MHDFEFVLAIAKALCLLLLPSCKRFICKVKGAFEPVKHLLIRGLKLQAKTPADMLFTRDQGYLHYPSSANSFDYLELEVCFKMCEINLWCKHY